MQYGRKLLPSITGARHDDAELSSSVSAYPVLTFSKHCLDKCGAYVTQTHPYTSASWASQPNIARTSITGLAKHSLGSSRKA